MKRTKQTQTNIDAILTGDWHLREDTPICRTDDFQTAQWEKVRIISDLQKKYNCPVIHSGDLFHQIINMMNSNLLAKLKKLNEKD